MVHRFLHLSDIHFGQERDGTLVPHNSVRDELVKDVEKLAKQRGSASRVLLTGDISYSGKAEEYEVANQWLEKLTTACQCKDETHVSTIPGNHDCDLSAINYQAKMVYATMRASTPELVQAQLHAINSDGEAGSPFLPKLSAYRKFASGFGCDFESAKRPLWVRDFDLPGNVKLRFHGLTSVQVSDKTDAVGKMVLGNSQYTMGEHANVINIVMCHHPLDWFVDEKEASDYIQNNARLLIVGHEHDVKIQKMSDVLGEKEWLVIFAGATNPPEAPVYDYTYNWLEMSCEADNGRHYLVVEIFPRIWVQEKVCFDANRKRLGAQGESVRVRILCGNVTPDAVPVAVAVAAAAPPAAEDPPAPPGPAAASEVPATLPEDGPTMNTKKPGFDRLRYLFWRYLDWRQRLKVLVDLDGLPKTADQPVPQTLEQVALENLSNDAGKLHALWEAIMPLIPEEKREANPFPPKGE